MQKARSNLGKALGIFDFKDLRDQQKQMRDRFIAWEKARRNDMVMKASKRDEDVCREFERQAEQLTEQHEATVADVEDKHVMAEANLRDAHKTEVRNTATALRHMEAYCRGESVTGELHNRTITEQDRRELEKTRHSRDHMDVKHTNAINVLRGEQNQRMKLRLQRQIREHEQLEERKNRAAESAQHEHIRELQDLNEEVQRRKAQLESWWNLQTEIWRKKQERDTGVLFDGTLPPIPWVKDEPKDVEVDVVDASEMYGHAQVSNEPELPSMKKEHGISTSFALRSRLVS